MQDSPFPLVLVLGRDTCQDTIRSRAHLAELAVPYRYGNVEVDAAVDAWNRAFNDGERVTPVILVGDPKAPSHVLFEPTNEDLDAALGIADPS